MYYRAVMNLTRIYQVSACVYDQLINVGKLIFCSSRIISEQEIVLQCSNTRLFGS